MVLIPSQASLLPITSNLHQAPKQTAQYSSAACFIEW